MALNAQQERRAMEFIRDQGWSRQDAIELLDNQDFITQFETNVLKPEEQTLGAVQEATEVVRAGAEKAREEAEPGFLEKAAKGTASFAEGIGRGAVRWAGRTLEFLSKPLPGTELPKKIRAGTEALVGRETVTEQAGITTREWAPAAVGEFIGSLAGAWPAIKWVGAATKLGWKLLGKAPWVAKLWAGLTWAAQKLPWAAGAAKIGRWIGEGAKVGAGFEIAQEGELTTEGIGTGAALGGIFSAAGVTLQKVREGLTKINPMTKQAAAGKTKQQLTKLFKQADEAQKSVKSPSLLENVADDIDDAVKALQKENTTLNTAKKAIVNRKKDVQVAAKKQINAFNRKVAEKRWALTTAEANELDRISKEVLNRFKNGRISVKDLDQVIDRLQGEVSAQILAGTFWKGSGAKLLLDSLQKDLNTTLKSTLGSTKFTELNKKLHENISLLDPIKKGFGKTGKRGESFVNSVFSTSRRRETVDLIEALSKRARKDLISEAELAKGIMSIAGDAAWLRRFGISPSKAGIAREFFRTVTGASPKRTLISGTGAVQPWPLKDLARTAIQSESQKLRNE